MIIYEPFENNTETLLKIFSDNKFFLKFGDQLLKEGYIRNEDEIKNYSETNIPLPPSLATNNFICSILINTQERLTQEQIIEAKPILDKALNMLSNEESYYVKFLFNSLDVNKTYQVGERFQYHGFIYTTIQQTIGRKFFEDNAEEYFEKANLPFDYIPEWINNTKYKQNERVKYGNHIYKSLINDNMWSPQDFPAGWQLEKRSQD